MDEIVAPDVVTHDPIILDAPTGPASIRGGIEMIRKALTDFRGRGTRREDAAAGLTPGYSERHAGS